MARYEYRCITCKYEFEKIVPITDSDRQMFCPECESPTQKLISAFSFVDQTSPNRDIDCVVGADAEKKWNRIYDRKNTRDKLRAKNTLQQFKKSKKEVG